jgi:hypothetical protein
MAEKRETMVFKIVGVYSKRPADLLEIKTFTP